MAIEYLSRKQFAERIGVAPSALSRYELPEHDGEIGEGKSKVRGWLPATVDEWQASRPGSGRWRKGSAD